MPSQPFKIEQGRFGISLDDPGISDPCTASMTNFTDFTCQITSGALNTVPNISDATVPASWCKPEKIRSVVGASSYECVITFLQDPATTSGLTEFLYDHDADVAWVYLGLDGDNAPKAVAKVHLLAGAFGGDARTNLTATVTFPCEDIPAICFGAAAAGPPVAVQENYCLMYQTVAQTLPIGGPNYVSFTGVEADPSNMYDPGSGQIIARITGLYLIIARVEINIPVPSATGGDRMFLEVFENGAAPTRRGIDNAQGSVLNMGSGLVAMNYLAAGTALDIRVTNVTSQPQLTYAEERMTHFHVALLRG